MSCWRLIILTQGAVLSAVVSTAHCPSSKNNNRTTTSSGTAVGMSPTRRGWECGFDRFPQPQKSHSHSVAPPQPPCLFILYPFKLALMTAPLVMLPVASSFMYWWNFESSNRRDSEPKLFPSCCEKLHIMSSFHTHLLIKT